MEDTLLPLVFKKENSCCGVKEQRHCDRCVCAYISILSALIGVALIVIIFVLVTRNTLVKY